MTNNIIFDVRKVGDIKGDFFVPSYQRGYRWGAEEVLRLLNDISESAGSNYCLQPVVVRKTADRYELIDGQQRLTTLWLIYRHISEYLPKSKPKFSVDYQNRKETAAYLLNIDPEKSEANIDFWFIAKAYQNIKEWFGEDENDASLKAFNLFKQLAESVQIIWYETDEADESEAISIFTRLNSGKIPLTNAELVKAMFLRQNNETKLRREEIAYQWDSIEQDLHDNSLWCFLTNAAAGEYQTRIDLVLNLMAKKPPDAREEYYTFFYFDALHRQKNLDDIWREIQKNFLLLKNWRENHELYHKIGYLIAAECADLREIYDLAAGKKKDEFLAALDEKIKDSVKSDVNYGELSYEKRGDYEKISRLLLLFNVESVRRNGEESQWFPFDKFKFGGEKKKSWTLEHIHARKSEGLRTKEAWQSWLLVHADAVEKLANEENLAREMKEAAARANLARNEFLALAEDALSALSADATENELHTIGNLALLKFEDNAYLNNAAFDVKRDFIIKLDSDGKYIPFCTKKVFLKYYTPATENQLHFWSKRDRQAYIGAINKVLGKYLSEPIDEGGIL